MCVAKSLCGNNRCTGKLRRTQTDKRGRPLTLKHTQDKKNPQKASEKSVTLFACVRMSQAGDEHI